jgi:hypothetical protein
VLLLLLFVLLPAFAPPLVIFQVALLAFLPLPLLFVLSLLPLVILFVKFVQGILQRLVVLRLLLHQQYNNTDRARHQYLLMCCETEERDALAAGLPGVAEVEVLGSCLWLEEWARGRWKSWMVGC